MTFEKQDRYLVIKRKDLFDALDNDDVLELNRIAEKVAQHRKAKGKQKLECVVVEHDWPNYAETWAAIKRIESGNTETVESVLSEMETNARENGYHIVADALCDAMLSLYDADLINHKYYCECDAGCGNSYHITTPGETCLNCGNGTMQPQDVEPY